MHYEVQSSGPSLGDKDKFRARDSMLAASCARPKIPLRQSAFHGAARGTGDRPHSRIAVNEWATLKFALPIWAILCHNLERLHYSPDDYARPRAVLCAGVLACAAAAARAARLEHT
jgi:hypothetical protein